MCPPPSDISIYWSDEELCLSLEGMMHGSSLPVNVTMDLNPYHYKPELLPRDIWYFICSEEKKGTETGFWKAKGEPCLIFSNSFITGWRTTLEFYEGQAPHGRKTDWLMQEYRVTQKGLSDSTMPKEHSSLCTVFHSSGQSPNHENHNFAGADGTGGNTRRGSTSQSEVNKGNDMGCSDIKQIIQNNSAENSVESDYISKGEYLELQDLVPESDSSSSENSSRLSVSSDELFDSLALLQELETDSQNFSRQGAGCKFSISASRTPREVFLSPATSGSLLGGNGSKLPVKETTKTNFSQPVWAAVLKLHDKEVLQHAVGSQKVYQRNEGPSSRSLLGGNGSKLPVKETTKTNFSQPVSAAVLKLHDKEVLQHAVGSQKVYQRNEGPSSNFHDAATSGGKAVVGGEKKATDSKVKKLKKKYLCFMPF